MVNGQVCFRSDTFILFMIINLGLIFWSLYRLYQESLEKQSLQTKSSLLEEKGALAESQAEKERLEKEMALNQIENILEQKMQNGLRIPPGPESGPGPQFGLPVYTPTRGEPTDFYVVGYLSQRKDPDHMMKLLERYLQSNRYEYCTTHHLDPTIRIPIYTRNYEQLSDGDIIKVPGYKGKFRVFIYQGGTFRMIPY